MNSIRIFLFPDICREEEACLRALITDLEKSISIEEIRVGKNEKGFFKKIQIKKTSWIVARDWHSAVNYLSAFSTKSRTLVSVLSTHVRKATIWETWFRSIHPVLPPHIKLLAHSPLSYRFLKELVGVPDIQIQELPFPVPSTRGEKKESSFVVGAYCSYFPDNNLHFLLTIGHYLAKRDKNLQLKIWGDGPLCEHLMQIAKDLRIDHVVQIVRTSNFVEPELCDAALYFPQRNDHFSPLLMAASAGAVPICGNIAGIENYVRDSVTGFIFQEEDVRSIAELILTLKNHPYLCKEMGTRFNRDTLKKFSSAQLSAQYLTSLNGNYYQTQNYIRHAI